MTGLFGLIRLTGSRRALLGWTILSGLIAQTLTVGTLTAGAWIAGRALSGEGATEVPASFWLLGLLVLFTAAARWWQSHVSHDLAFGLIEVLQLGIYDGLERAAPGAILGRRTGELAGVANADAQLMEFFYAHTLGDYVAAIIVPLGALVGLYLVDPWLALALAPFLPLLASIPFWLARRAGEQGQAVGVAQGQLNADIVELIQGQRELALFGHGPRYLARLAARTDAFGAEQRRYGVRAGLEQAAVDLLLAQAMLTTAVVGMVLHQGGRLDMALVPVAVILAGAALGPVVEVTQTARRLGELRAGAERILAIFHQPPQVADTGLAQAPPRMDVQFDRVAFRYDATRGAALHDVSFSIAPGEAVALVGQSGAGKTTCANLLLRFWDAGQGAIRIGGTDIRDLPLSTLRKLVSVVPQDVHLFNESIADNIRLGCPDAPMQAVERAARLAQAHGFIMDLSNGYETICGERAVRLSGGQRQRIAIARAFLQDAPILIMDEAVSNLDTGNERALQAAMAALRHNRTLLLIAHRPSTIASADRLVRLDKGRVVGTGVIGNDRPAIAQAIL